MRALQLTVSEFEASIKPGGLLYKAIAQGIDPELIIDSTTPGQSIIVCLTPELERLIRAETKEV